MANAPEKSLQDQVSTENNSHFAKGNIKSRDGKIIFTFTQVMYSRTLFRSFTLHFLFLYTAYLKIISVLFTLHLEYIQKLNKVVQDNNVLPQMFTILEILKIMMIVK